MDDLQAVCERHGVLVEPNGNWPWVATGRKTEDPSGANTPDAAVCALLKARWGITCAPVPTRQNADRWHALHTRPEHDALMQGMMPPASTELAAVVALADRLRGEG